MGGSQPSGSGRARSGSQLSRVREQEQSGSNTDVGGHRGHQEVEERHNGWFRHRTESPSSRPSFSSSLNQKTPARSYFQHSLQESHGGEMSVPFLAISYLQHTAPVDITRNSSQGVREDTAELASLALSDIASNRSEHSPGRHHTPSASRRKSDSHLGSRSEQDELTHQDSNDSSRPDVIEEVSEPSSPHSSHSSRNSRCQSALTELIKNSPPTEEEGHDTDEDDEFTTAGIHPVTVQEGIISQPSERTPLLGKRTAYGSIKDIESQKTFAETQLSKQSMVLQQVKDRLANVVKVASTPKMWNREDVWEYGIRQPASLIPPVILGLLLNILDALSYG